MAVAAVKDKLRNQSIVTVTLEICTLFSYSISFVVVGSYKRFVFVGWVVTV